jgi:hypothetical protein
MKNGNPFDLDDQDELIRALKDLEVAAPANTMGRLRKRLRAFLLGCELLDTQVYGFWTVLDALLRILFRFVSLAPEDRRPEA